MKKNVIGILACTIIMICAVLVFGPLDLFTHGYFCDEINCGQIEADDFAGYVRLEDGDFEMKFSPQKKHFAGFQIYLVNQPHDNTGTLVLTVSEENGKQVDKIEVNLGRVPEASWYKLYTSASIKKNKVYTLRFSAIDCAVTPYLQMICLDYLPEETVSESILIGYAYADSTFTPQNRVLIGLFAVAVWGFVCACFLGNRKTGNCVKGIAAFLFIMTVLSWNYMYNSMDNENTAFSIFQLDSETLTSGMVFAAQDGVSFLENDDQGYGLGRYYNIRGEWGRYNLSLPTDDNWLDGYSRMQAAININSNIYTENVAVPGNYIGFDNGDMFRIIGIEDGGQSPNPDGGNNLAVYLDTDTILTKAKYGDLDNVTFYDADKRVLDPSLIVAYKSQYGLQGKVFKHLSSYMDSDQAIANLNLICCIITAAVFTLILFLLAVKYNYVMSGCFLVTFWLSPWIVNFARNLYWVEFTWFIPMAIGLFCAWKIENRKCRILSYVAAFFAVAVKCLCGYEYITVVMMGLVSFLLIDFVCTVIRKDKAKGRLLFRTIFILGVAALSAFAVAILIHAILRGNGDVWQGVKNIIKEDVLRSTYGADFNSFDSSYWPLFNASAWSVFRKYFHFSTELIVGVGGNLFPLLCIVPLCIFMYEYEKSKLNYEHLIMYIVFFLTSISWFCLAKSHSYEHGHMNFVLWYFGFVQTCFYVIVNKVICTFKGSQEHEKGD